jgi:YVTN family beta-propeller protein
MSKQLEWKPSSPSSKVENQTQAVWEPAQALQNRVEKVEHHAEEMEKLAKKTAAEHSDQVDQLRTRAAWYRTKADHLHQLHQRRTFLILREEWRRITAWIQIQQEKKTGKYPTFCSDSICSDESFTILKGILELLEAETQAGGNFAYVTYVAYENSIFVIDIDGHVVIDRINSSATAIAITPNGNQAYVSPYVSPYQSPIISVTDTDINQVIATIEVNTGHAYKEVRVGGIAFTPDGNRAYAVINLQTEPAFCQTVIVVISTDSRTVIATIKIKTEMKSTSEGIAISPDGKKVYVLSQECSLNQNGVISVIAIDSNTVIATIRLERISGHPTSNRIAITPNGNWAYVTHMFNQSISVINMNTNEVTATISVEGKPREIVIAPNGAWAYVKLYEGKVMVIDINSNAVIKTIRRDENKKVLIKYRSYAYIYSIGNHKVIDTSLINRCYVSAIQQLT